MSKNLSPRSKEKKSVASVDLLSAPKDSSPALSVPAQWNLYLGDPLAKYIIERLKWSPVQTAFVATTFAFVISALLALSNQRFSPSTSDTYIAYTQDWSYLITELFANPVIWGYFVWTCFAPFDVLRKLQTAGIIKVTEQKCSVVEKIISQSLWGWVALAISLAVGYGYFTGSIDWLNTRSTFLLRIILIITPAAYAISLGVFRTIIAGRIFREFMDEVFLHPLHPDKVGGLKPLADYSMRITWAIIVFGITGALIEISTLLRDQSGEGLFVHGTFLIYLLVAPIVFFYPLSIAHRAMKTAKQNFLLEISKQFNNIIAHTRLEIQNDKFDLEDEVSKIDQLKMLHEVGSAFPVWPFDTATLRRFSLSMLTPLATFALPFVVKLVVIPFLEPILPLPIFEVLKGILDNL